MPRKALLAILATSVAARVIAAVFQGDEVASLPGIHDQITYDSLARRVLSGHGFRFGEYHWPATHAGEPTAHWSYLYTSYLAAVYGIAGHHPLAARLVQAVLAGVLHPWLAWRIGRRLFDARIGLAAAGITAVYAYFVYYAGALVTEAFYLVAVLWFLDLATAIAAPGRGGADPPAGKLVLLGLALGVAALLRQVILVFAPFAFAWLWWSARRAPDGAGASRRMLRRLVLSAAVTAALIAPWTVRNYLAFGSFVPLNTNAGFAFFWANHPIHGTDFVPILPWGSAYYDLIPDELRPLNEADLDRALLWRGIGVVVGDPVRYGLLSLSRVDDYFKFWPSSTSSVTSNVARAASFGLCLPLILVGLAASLRARARGAPAPSGPSGAGLRARNVGLLYWFIGIYSLIHLLSWVTIRYRLPVDAVLVIFAGVGMVATADRVRPRGQDRWTARAAGAGEEP